MRCGVLALQGDFEAHGRMLQALGQSWEPVRTARELEAVDALVVPGGESTTMLRLMEAEALGESLRARARGGLPILATCAGIILLARKVFPPQPALGLLDVTVRRNAYGRQVASAVVPLRVAPELGDPPTMEGVFIRAPRIEGLGEGVRALAWRDEDPVLVRQGRIVAATFHPELTADSRVHRMFLEAAHE